MNFYSALALAGLISPARANRSQNTAAFTAWKAVAAPAVWISWLMTCQPGSSSRQPAVERAW